MAKFIHIADTKGRDANVLFTGFNKKSNISYFTPDGNAVHTVRVLKTTINGSYDKKDIREFIEYGLLAKDSRALREYITQIAPGVDLTYNYVFDTGAVEDITIPISTGFFLPDT